MTLDDSGWILTKADFWRREVGDCTKADFWRREVGDCSLSRLAKVPDIKENLFSSRRRYSE